MDNLTNKNISNRTQDYIKALYNIGQVGPNQKYSISTGDIQDNNSYVGWTYTVYNRYMTGEDRKNLHDYIASLLNYADNDYIKYHDNVNNLEYVYRAVKSGINGIANMTNTVYSSGYYSDEPKSSASSPTTFVSDDKNDAIDTYDDDIEVAVIKQKCENNIIPENLDKILEETLDIKKYEHVSDTLYIIDVAYSEDILDSTEIEPLSESEESSEDTLDIDETESEEDILDCTVVPVKNTLDIKDCTVVPVKDVLDIKESEPLDINGVESIAEMLNIKEPAPSDESLDIKASVSSDENIGITIVHNTFSTSEETIEPEYEHKINMQKKLKEIFGTLENETNIEENSDKSDKMTSLSDLPDKTIQLGDGTKVNIRKTSFDIIRENQDQSHDNDSADTLKKDQYTSSTRSHVDVNKKIVSPPGLDTPEIPNHLSEKEHPIEAQNNKITDILPKISNSKSNDLENNNSTISSLLQKIHGSPDKSIKKRNSIIDNTNAQNNTRTLKYIPACIFMQ